MTSPTEQLPPVFERAVGDVYDHFPGDSWRDADLVQVVGVALAQIVSESVEIIARWQHLEKLALVLSWSPARPPATFVEKALMELYLEWVDMNAEGFSQAKNHPELEAMIPTLAKAFETRQSSKISQSATAQKALLLPGDPGFVKP